MALPRLVLFLGFVHGPRVWPLLRTWSFLLGHIFPEGLTECAGCSRGLSTLTGLGGKPLSDGPVESCCACAV